ncbi:MAG: disulfide bond formation protein B [Pseudomonadota bacterium]
MIDTDYRTAATRCALWIALLLGGAQIAEHALYMEPCPLCLTQRVFFILAGFAAFAAMHATHPSRGWSLLTGLFALGGLAFALRQLYLYTLPPEQIPACTAPIGMLIEFAPIAEVLRAMTMGTGNCAEDSFPVFGLQVPGIAIPLAALIGFIGVLFLVAQQLRRLDR